jgi:hypothetical protein
MARYRFTDRMDLLEEPSSKSVAHSQDDGDRHVHIWIDLPPTQSRAADAPRPRSRQRDREGAANELPLATLRRFDDGGEQPYWVGREADGRMYCARQETDGDLSLSLVQGTGEAGDASLEKLEIRHPPGSYDSPDDAAYDRMVRNGWNGSDISDGFAITRGYISRVKAAFESQRRPAK